MELGGDDKEGVEDGSGVRLVAQELLTERVGERGRRCRARAPARPSGWWRRDPGVAASGSAAPSSDSWPGGIGEDGWVECKHGLRQSPSLRNGHWEGSLTRDRF